MKRFSAPVIATAIVSSLIASVPTADGRLGFR
jgi:hypothetical protein